MSIVSNTLCASMSNRTTCSSISSSRQWRKVNMTISLVFLGPRSDQRATMAGCHGMGVARLCDLPAEWSRQRIE
jgi:hypothetical protein